MKDLLANRGTVNTHDHLCGLMLRQSFWSWSRVRDGIRYASPFASGQQGPHDPSAGGSPSQNTATTTSGASSQTSWAPNTSITIGSQTNQQPLSNTVINVRGTNQSIILLGVKGPRITLELAQIDTLKYCRDALFFWTLKQQYKQCRGRLRHWLSIWKLTHCDFVKVIFKQNVNRFSVLTSASSKRYGRTRSSVEAKISPQIHYTITTPAPRAPTIHRYPHTNSRPLSLHAATPARSRPSTGARGCRRPVVSPSGASPSGPQRSGCRPMPASTSGACKPNMPSRSCAC